MTRPKQLPNEHLSDLAISTATKLQCFRHLSKYLKRSAKALEQQVIREMRFYGALIRLQQNWKIKRQRQAVSVQSGEGFSIDLDDCLSSEHASSRSISMVHVDKDSSGMLSLELPVNACRSLCFGFLGGGNLSYGMGKASKSKFIGKQSDESNKDSSCIDKSVSHMHSVLCKVQRALFEEQVFELVKRDAVNPLHRINVVGMAENHLELNIGGQTCIFISLVASDQDDGGDNGDGERLLVESDTPSLDASGRDELENKSEEEQLKPNISCSIGFGIFLQQLFHQNVYQKYREGSLGSSECRLPTHTSKDGSGKLIHFCASLEHRRFSTKVLMELENLVRKVPYLCLLSHMTWHSRVSAWTVFMKLPQSILLTHRRSRQDDAFQMNQSSHFRCKVVIQDDLIIVEGEGGTNSTGLSESISDKFPVRRYSCNLADLSFTLLQQFAGQIVGWLHEEVVKVGMKVSRDYLRLSFEMEGGEKLSLLAQLDLDHPDTSISWCLLVGDKGDTVFLGHLSLDLLYSSVMDLVTLCTTRLPILPP